MLKIKQFTFNPIEENTYILYEENGECAIVDPGCYFPYERDALTSFIESEKLTPKALLNTHCHLDHVFGTAFIARQFDLRPRIHPKEEGMLAYAPVTGEQWGLPFEGYAGPLEYLEEGEEVRVGGSVVKALFTPGHAPGHLSFYCAAQGFVLSGDALFRAGIGRTDLPFGDHATLLRSIREQLFTLPDETVVYPGHGPQTTIGYERQYNPFLAE